MPQDGDTYEEGFAVYLLYALVVMHFFGACQRAVAADDVLSQADAQKLAAQVREQGSDQSLRVSTTMAMQALIKFSDSDIPGAFSTAYRAYGKFKTAENLDRARKQGLLAKAGLGSAGTNTLTPAEASFLGSPTTFRRLDPSFLTSGDDAKLAAEFEARTGITGKDFVGMLASASETKLYVSDPKLAEKVEAEFESFLGKIPNAEFKAKVRASLGVVPMVARQKVLMEGVQKMLALMGPVKSSTVSEAELAKISVQPAAIAPARVPAEAVVVASEPLATATGTAAETSVDEEAMLTGLTLHKDEMAKTSESENPDQILGSVYKAVAETENETIFAKVKRKYRALTPRMK